MFLIKKFEKELIIKNFIVLITLILLFGCSSKKPETIPDFDFNKDKTVENSNFYNMNKLFKEMKLPENKDDDYYFVAVGDTRNMIRSDDLSGFNQIAKQIIYAKDENNKNIYDKIKFIIHMGDIVYEGAVKRQWDNIKKAFSKKDYFYENYPYIKILTRDKPIFPVLGNHEIMKFKLKKETPYMNLASSNKGLKYFNEFFKWDSFIANPNILYPIPAKLKKKTFDKLCEKLNKTDINTLEKHYVLKYDNSYHLKVFQKIIKLYKKSNGLKEVKNNFIDPIQKKLIINDLQKIFIKLGYNTLPVLSPDNNIAYAFEINDLIYLIFDSMSRGWQYSTFTGLKKSIYHKKNKQHYLNLFSKSDINGQYGFYKAVSEYAGKQGKTIIPFMHHSPFSSTGNIDGGGIQYNYKLMLGVEYKKKNNKIMFNKNISDYSFFDDVIFSTARKEKPGNIFTSCVHYFQSFTLTTKKDNQNLGNLNWFITGGGGGELETKYDNKNLHNTESLYNKKLDGRSIKIINNKVEKKYNFILVHVKNSKIINVKPYFVDKKDVRLKKKTINLSAKIESYYFSKPASTSNLVSLRLGQWGLEKFIPMFAFITWEPSIGIGYFNYDINGIENDMSSLTQFEPFKFTLNFSKFKQISFSFFGMTAIAAGTNSQRGFLAFGFDGPLLYNFFSHTKGVLPKILKKIILGLRYYIPLPVGNNGNQNYGKDIRWAWTVQFSIF